MMNIFSMALLFLFTTYLGWFNFLDTLAFDTDERSIHTFAVESCLHPITETKATIPLRKMIA
ncbi:MULTISPECIES: hypothetical protein [unclassified Peribacillus]|uniref:hypothetical protein n=1 Tax=unclassified Peribacillus TaxID=2675266 RepID=UPI0019129449|nr:MULTISPECIES: hypothetical protein [unclassified Peribacillus]MBK5445127.1 hypothetical protein [Peribacillus sp. TH24]MBK5498342.1 hypothetical protein [Peribacillus sp. TH14]